MIQLKIIRGFCSTWTKSDTSVRNSATGVTESMKRKSTTPSTQASKVVKSEPISKPREMNSQMKSRERERKKSQSKEFRRSVRTSGGEADLDECSSLIKISNGHFTMKPSTRYANFIEN